MREWLEDKVGGQVGKWVEWVGGGGKGGWGRNLENVRLYRRAAAIALEGWWG